VSQRTKFAVIVVTAKTEQACFNSPSFSALVHPRQPAKELPVTLDKERINESAHQNHSRVTGNHALLLGFCQ
jgi:hypothetical protein